jgi:Mor family transcriptional regulator
MYEEYQAGKTARELEVKYGITLSRVRHIVTFIAKREQEKLRKLPRPTLARDLEVFMVSQAGKSTPDLVHEHRIGREQLYAIILVSVAIAVARPGSGPAAWMAALSRKSFPG